MGLQLEKKMVIDILGNGSGSRNMTGMLGWANVDEFVHFHDVLAQFGDVWRNLVMFWRNLVMFGVIW